MVCASCGHENGDAARFCQACGAVLGGVSGERRKVVSVLSCDVVGSTALGELTDPEALRALLARFIGDAVMAVFGVPVVMRTMGCGPVGRRWRCARRLPGWGSRDESG
jgi:class 3 adenylate cyclase